MLKKNILGRQLGNERVCCFNHSWSNKVRDVHFRSVPNPPFLKERIVHDLQCRNGNYHDYCGRLLQIFRNEYISTKGF